MKKYTLEELKQSPNTLMKFFILQGKAKTSMIDDAFEFYKTFSKHDRKKKKTFTKNFLWNLKTYNNRVK